MIDRMGLQVTILILSMSSWYQGQDKTEILEQNFYLSLLVCIKLDNDIRKSSGVGIFFLLSLSIFSSAVQHHLAFTTKKYLSSLRFI
jgi:hypothetical protein